jgi:CO/xanthine dehydrogenase FAD-binding subunit
MIIEYFRPDTVNDALKLLNRPTPRSVPLGGGTDLAQTKSDDAIAVVDLQALGMREIVSKKGILEIGANVYLQQLHDCQFIPAALRTSLAMEGNFNLRQMATVGGTIASSDGGSAIMAILLAADAEILWEPGNRLIPIVEFIQDFRSTIPGFISGLRFPLSVKTSLERVSRTPLSESILCVCGARKPDGIARILIPDSNSSIAVEMFEGKLETDKPDAKEIVKLWSNRQQEKVPYVEAILAELIKRVLNDLGKEG